jgi:hypothetical protein
MSRLISIVGTPSPLFHATLDLVRAAVQVCLGDHKVVCANSMEALRAEFPSRVERNSQPVVLYSDYPRIDILSTYTKIQAPVAICADDFLTVAHYSVVWRDFGGVDAARFASMALVNIEPIISEPPPLSLVINNPKISLTRLIDNLSLLYRLSIDAGAKAKILGLLNGVNGDDCSLGEYATRVVKPLEPAREILERRSPLENELIDFLAPQYDGIVRGRRLESLQWPVFALLRPEFPDRLTIGPIDMTGPARFIYYGPYFALPAGAWSADVSFEVSECFGEDVIEIDVTAGKVLAAVRTKLPRQGVFGCQIRFPMDDPSQLVEIRLRLLTGAIEGVIRMHAITLHRIATLDEAERDEEAPLDAEAP